MDTKKRFLSILLVGVVVGLLAAVALPADASRWLGYAPAPRLAPPAQISSALLQGLYLGTVELDWAVPGEFSDNLSALPDQPDLGNIDLALQLSHDGSTISGYVDLEFTLVFSTEHVVDETAYGPSVTGSFDGTNLTLTSEQVSLSSAGRSLMRQFRLTGQMVSEENNTLSGEYRETLWGYGPQPLTIVGNFTLVGPQLLPKAKFVAGPTTGPARLEVTFSDLSSNEPTSWSWDFGDGQTSTERDPSHTYDQPGDYTVSLTVSNDYGSDTKTEVDYISVGEPIQPIANFYASPISGTVPLLVTFSDLSVGSPESWLWNFGDGSTSTEQNPSHTYFETGSFSVTLTVSNTLGSDTMVDPDCINVTAGAIDTQPIYLPLIFKDG
jgi:PKD repeat protein